MDKVIFCDFFGVICSEVANTWYMKYFDKEKALELKDATFVRADRGDITEEEAYNEMSNLVGIPVEEIKKEWKELMHINRELVDYLAEIKKTHKVYLLSNAVGSFLERILDENDLYRIFNKVYISGNLRLIKPNTDYYNYAINDLGISPSDAVMIDDNPLNIKGAEEAGITGIVYKNNEDLFKKLERIL